MGEPHGNLTKEYPPQALVGWEGCSHLDCLNGCNYSVGHCERLAEVLKKNGWIGKFEQQPRHEGEDMCPPQQEM